MLDNYYNKMDKSEYKERRSRNDKLRTICTIDTYDPNFVEIHHSKENRNRNCPYLTIPSKSTLKHKRKDSQFNKSHHKSQHQGFIYSRVKDTTPKTRMKRIQSNKDNNQCGRIKTQYSQYQQPLGFRKIVNSLKKKLVYPSEEYYRLQAIKIVKKIRQRSGQVIYTAKWGTTKPKSYILIKCKTNQSKQRYEQENKTYNAISASFRDEFDKKILLKINNIWKEKKEWLILTQKFTNPSWFEDQFYLFLNSFKSDNDLLRNFTKEAAKSILAISNAGYVHNNISLQSMFFPLIKGQMKFNGTLKIGGLFNCELLKHKDAYLNMPILYRTPPEILNFLLFECQQPFDRDALEHITVLKAGWQTDMWSLGILILQLLNGGPLADQNAECSQLINLQKEIVIRYSYLFQKIDEKLRLCLLKMLSLNPENRMNPKQLLRML